MGAFHRAHQAVYMHRLMQLGDARWTLVGGNIRNDSPRLMEDLHAANGEYILETVSPCGEFHYETIGSIARVLSWDSRLCGVVDVGARSSTKIISFTVTEAGYCLDATGRLDRSRADLQQDVENSRRGLAGSTIYGALTSILTARAARSTEPVTLLSCDNLRSNGDRFRTAFLDYLGMAGRDALAEWVERHTRCPNSMVDRITPRPDAALRDRVKAISDDKGDIAVSSETFTQWIIENQFCTERPEWERVGVQMVDSVAPYEEAKIRILNASHSCLAWAGSAAGLQYIHEDVADPRIRGLTHEYLTGGVVPCLHAKWHPYPMDLAAYREAVLVRFQNALLRDTNQRIAMDSLSKFATFIAPTIREALKRGSDLRAVAIPAALLFRFLERWVSGQLPFSLELGYGGEADVRHAFASADPVDKFCSSRTLLGDVAGQTSLSAAVRSWLTHPSALG